MKRAFVLCISFLLLAELVSAQSNANVTLESLAAQMQDLRSAIDTTWLLVTGFLVLLMQTGFAMLESGSVQPLEVRNILFKNIMDTTIGGVVWYLIGFAFAFGDENPNHFIGHNYFVLNKDADGASLALWLFEFSFAAVAATILSGAVAERIKFTCYFICIVLMVSWVYPVIVHWVWSNDGWLSGFNTDTSQVLFGVGLVDFAGSGVVHLTGGMAGLVGAKIVDYRNKLNPEAAPRFEKVDVAPGESVGGAGESWLARWFCCTLYFEKHPQNKRWRVNPMSSYSETFTVLGCMLLWFGWYGFNCGSSLAMVGKTEVTARAAINTTLAPCTAGLLTVFLGRYITGSPNFAINDAVNGILAGAVAITAGSGVVEPWAALIIGLIGGFIFKASSEFLLLVHIDDPVDAAPVHAFCGFWGLIAVGLFADQHAIEQTYNRTNHYGLFVGGGGTLLAAQIVGGLCIACFSGFFFAVLFYGMKFVDRRLNKKIFLDIDAISNVNDVAKTTFVNPQIALKVVSVDDHGDEHALDGQSIKSDVLRYLGSPQRRQALLELLDSLENTTNTFNSHTYTGAIM